jgi:CHAT domain-containing protein/tetratricopeptide (TPR) repeat protein
MNSQTAIALFEQAADEFRRAGDTDNNAKVAVAIGLTRLQQGDVPRALAAFNDVAAYAHKRNNLPLEAAAHGGIGFAGLRSGLYADALKSFDKALQMWHALGDRGEEASMYLNIGMAEQLRGNYNAAVRSYKHSVEINEVIDNPAGVADGLSGFALAAEAMGRYDEALKLLQDAVSIRRKIVDRSGEAEALASIGSVERRLGRFYDALTSLQQALAIHRDLRNSLAEASNLSLISAVQGDLGQFAEALESSFKALEIDRRSENRYGLAEDLINAAAAEYRLGHYQNALRFAREASTLSAQMPSPDARWRSFFVAGLSEASLNRREEAISDYDAGLDQIESIRAGVDQIDRPAFLWGKVFAYDSYITYLQDLNDQFPGTGYDRKAFEIFERKKARAVLEQIAGSAAQRFGGIPPEVIARERATQAGVYAAQREASKLLGLNVAYMPDVDAAVGAANAARAEFETEVRDRYPAYYVLLHPPPISAATVQETLAADEALLAYDVHPEKSILITVTHDSVSLMPIPGSAVLLPIVARVRAHIDDIGSRSNRAMLERAAAHDIPMFAADSFSLYRQLIPVAINPLISGKRLIVVPSGPLFDVAFEALVTSVSGTSPRYFLEDHAISYAPSASLLSVVRKTRHQPRRRAPLLAFANPSPVRETLGDLPGAEREARRVRDALGAPADSVITGSKATKARLMSLNASGALATYRYLFFGTHTSLTRVVTEADQPALELAPAGAGAITMAEVFGLSLDADFVALSACSTGQGAGDAGDGISGLTRAFLYAGTPAISVTLWDVDDEAAPKIMPPFFASMSGGTAPAEALRLAKLRMLHSSRAKFRHPYAWAPSVIFGDGDIARR